MKYSYYQKSNWLLSDLGLTNRLTIHGDEFATINTPCEFIYLNHIIVLLKKFYNYRQEKGGLICFEPRLLEGKIKYVAVKVIPVENISENKNIEFKPDPAILNKGLQEALSKKLLPFFFHTHPTMYTNNNLSMQGLNFLQQLNTSIQDQGMTLWCFKYNNIYVRLPQILILENANALFIGMYGGLVAPLCFTEEKTKAMNEGLEKTFSTIGDWANTPGKQTALVVSSLTLAFTAIAFPKIVLPTAMAIGTIAPPMIYASREKHQFFGITYFKDLKIQIPKLSNSQIVDFEISARIALTETKRIAEEETKWKKAS